MISLYDLCEDMRQEADIAVWRGHSPRYARLNFLRQWITYGPQRRDGRAYRQVDCDPATHLHLTPEPGIDRAIRSLTPRQQELIRLIFWDGLLWREIAELWHVSVNTIGAHYTRAINHLRRILCARSPLPSSSPLA